MIWWGIIDFKGGIKDDSLHIIIADNCFMGQITMRFERMKSYLQFGVAIGESPIQYFRDIDINFWAHLFIIKRSICGVNEILIVIKTIKNKNDLLNFKRAKICLWWWFI